MGEFFAVFPPAPGECLGITTATDEEGARSAFSADGLFDQIDLLMDDDDLRIVGVHRIVRSSPHELPVRLAEAVGGTAASAAQGQVLLHELGRWGMVQRDAEGVSVYRPASISLDCLRMIMSACPVHLDDEAPNTADVAPSVSS